MIAWKRAALVGFASWLIPFIISFLIFPLKESNAPRFETLMTLIVLITAGVLFQLYFRGRAVSIHEALLVGVMWFVVNLMLDYPMFAFGPMKIEARAYYSEIGLNYLTFPAFGFWPRGWHGSETVHRTGLPRAYRANTGIHLAASGRRTGAGGFGVRRRLRLERAAQKLKQQDGAITDIAFEAGFETHESFTRAFGAMFGVSPSGYRAVHNSVPKSASGTHLDDVSRYRPPDYGETLPVEVKGLPSVKLVFLRHTGPYSEVGATWGRLMTWAGMRGRAAGGRVRCHGNSWR